jgi:hypothetical protein
MEGKYALKLSITDLIKIILVNEENFIMVAMEIVNVSDSSIWAVAWWVDKYKEARMKGLEEGKA